MRFLYTLSFLLAITGSTFAQERWQEFKSLDGNFRVLAPGEFIEKIDSMDTPVGRVAFHTFFYQPEDEKTAENLFYMVSYHDYPEGTLSVDSTELLEEFFKESIEAAAFSINGKIMYSADFEFYSYPGRVWRIDYLNGQAIVKTRAYLVGQRYYSIQTISLKEKHLNSSSDKFMDSFDLLN